MSIKRNSSSTIQDCDIYMKKLKLSHNSPIKKVNKEKTKEPNKEIIDNIKNSENSLNIKIKIIEDSVENRLNHIDNEIKNINTKLDKLLNIVTNAFFEKPAFNHQSNYVS